MAPRRVYPEPATQLAELAAAAKRAGVEFDLFWRQAMRPGERAPLVTDPSAPDSVVRWPSDRGARIGWRTALLDDQVREAWRRAYEDLPPTRGELAIALLLSALADAPAGEPLLVAA